MGFSGLQWHQLDNMQTICSSLQIDDHTNTSSLTILHAGCSSWIPSPVWARGRCRISPPRFLAECCKRQLNPGSFILLYFRLFTFSDLYWVCLYFSVLFCLSVSVKWLAVKTTSEMTSFVSGGALNSTQTKPNPESQQTVSKHWKRSCTSL